jgi:hypothetical protein
MTFNTTTTGTINLRVGMATDGTTFTASERGLQVYVGTNQQVLVWGSQLSNTSTVQPYYATTTAAYTQCAPRGLLIEESRVNSLTYSEDLTNAAWVLGDNTITSNAIVAPDGNTTADLLIPTATTTTHAFYQASSVTSGSTYTLSMYAKAGAYAFINCYGSTGFDSTQYINFDLSSGTLFNTNGFTGTITSVGNGWYRITVTAVSNATSASGRIVFRASSTNRSASSTYTGNGTSGVYIWGVQFELGAFATSYIPTTTAAATRSADVATMTGTNFSSWYNPSQGTIFGQYTSFANLTARYIVDLEQAASSNNRIDININTSNTINPRTVVGGSAVATLNGGAYTVNTNAKIAFAYASADYASSFNAAAAVTASTAGALPSSLARMFIGCINGSSFLNGWMQRVSYYPTRLANSTLQVLTT